MTSLAYAADAASAGSPLGGLIPMILIFVVFYFLLIRPQQQKAKLQQSFLSSLKKGDVVITSGGLHGTIKGLTDKVVTLEIAENIRVKVSRQNVLSPASALSDKKGDGCKSGG
jgi:preprotein translocase subunit YajC